MASDIEHAGDELPAEMGALRADPEELPCVGPPLRELAATAGVPTPNLWVLDDALPQAMATGPNARTASVTVSAGLLQHLDDRELRAVLAHEVGHVAREHVGEITAAGRRAAAGAALAGGAAAAGAELLTDTDLGWIAGLIGGLVGGATADAGHRRLTQRIRGFELEADAVGAQLGGSPRALQSALRTLESRLVEHRPEEWQQVLNISEPGDDPYATIRPPPSGSQR